MKKTSLLFLYAFNYCAAQPVNIMIANERMNPQEPCIAINYLNINQLVVGTNSNAGNTYYYSQDAGLTWKQGSLVSTLGFYGDPVLLSDTLGNFYYFHLSESNTATPPDRIVCPKLTGISNSWSNGTFTGLNGTKYEDKNWATINPRNNNIYVTWTQFDNGLRNAGKLDSTTNLFSKSEDLGQTWSTPKRISKGDGNCGWEDLEDPKPCIGENGEIYITWADSSQILFNRSMDNGNTWLSQDVLVTSIPGERNYHVSGIERGKVRTAPMLVSDNSKGINHGNIYMLWTDQRNGKATNTDIWISKSLDKGDTWGPAIKVNDDHTNTQQFMATICIDQSNGNIYSLFYDRRNYSNDSTDVYMAVSKDGGNSFKNYKISQRPFLWKGSIFYGDYISIAAQNEIVRPVWTRSDNNKTSVWTAIVDLKTLDVENTFKESNQAFELVQNYPNPFETITAIEFNVFFQSDLSLEVVNIYGRKISTLIENIKYGPGKYSIVFDNTRYHLPSGIYFICLSNNFITKNKSLVILK